MRIREGARTPSPATVAAAAAAADKAAADELQRIQQQRERMREKGATGVARAGALRDLGTNAKAADCRELYAASKRNDNKAADACARQAALEAARDVIRRNADPEEVELALDLAQKALQRRKSGGPRDEDAMARLGALQCLREGLKSSDEHVQALAYRRLPNAAKALADGDDKVRRCAAHVVSDALGGVRAPGPKPPGANKLARTAARAAVDALADRFGDAAAVVACVDATGLWTPEVTEAVVAKRAATKVIERRAVADALATAPAGDDVDEALAAVRGRGRRGPGVRRVRADDAGGRRRGQTRAPAAPRRRRRRGAVVVDRAPAGGEAAVARAVARHGPRRHAAARARRGRRRGGVSGPARRRRTRTGARLGRRGRAARGAGRHGRRGAGGIGEAPEPELTAS